MSPRPVRACRSATALLAAALLVVGCTGDEQRSDVADPVAVDRTPAATTTTARPILLDTPFGGRGTASVLFGGLEADFDDIFCSRNGDVVQAVLEPADSEVLRDLRVVVSDQTSVTVTDVDGLQWQTTAPSIDVGGDILRVEATVTRGAAAIGLIAVFDCGFDADGS